jgi:protein tyrosine kinase modulator
MATYWAIAKRRFWWVFLSVFICWAGVWAFSWTVPATYESEALILVQQQQVPQSYVASNVTLSLQDRLQSMTQQILSRTRLQTTIERFHLYPAHRSLLNFRQPADPVEEMRKDIKIDLVRSSDHPGDLTAFKVRYAAASPQLAQQVNNELTSMFIDENLQAQEQESESTTSFLNSQLADARTKLQNQEAKVRSFKSQHFGDLPGQLQSNLQILSGLQGQLETSQRNLDAARQQHTYLQSLLSDYESQESAAGALGSGAAPAADSLDAQLKQLNLQLAQDRAKYTEDYPDVVALKDKIAQIQQLRKQQAKAQSASAQAAQSASGQAPAQNSDTTLDNPAAMQLQSQLQANQLEIQNYQKQAKNIAAAIAGYQARLNQEPRTEQELADISRGYEESMSNYDSLLKKQMESQLATSLEQRQQGEQFRVLDPPSLPAHPSSPRHIFWSFGGLALGLLLGVGLAALLELSRVRVWQRSDVEAVVPARVLIAIPRLSTPREDRLHATARWLKLSAAAALLFVMALGNLYSFYKG